MKILFIILYLLFSFNSSAQIITTFAGNGVIGNCCDNGLATIASIAFPDACAFDSKGNFYFTTVGNDKVRKVAPNGFIYTVAGVGISGYNGDEILATLAELNIPTGIAVDKDDNIYIADGNNNRIRKIDVLTGIISTVAGNGSLGFGGDGGAATAATFYSIEDICFDKVGNLFISDYDNFRIRKINTSGIISTFAGNGTNGYSGDGGDATNAEIQAVKGICTDKLGNVFITQNYNIRMINSTGIITTIAGNGLVGPSGDGFPATAAGINPVRIVSDDYKNIYISDYGNDDVRVIDKYGIIHTIAGTGVYGYSGDGGPATTAELSSTYGIALDSCGNVYIADKDNVRIRKIALNPKCVNLGTDNITDKTDLNIYPNPIIDNLNIDNLKTPSTYQITNLIGTTMQQGTLKKGNNIISLQYLPPGMYLLELIGEEGERVVRKVVKE